MQVPFPDNSFDIVICNHVYEHVPDSQLLVNDIYRILKPGGYCYFAAGNKYNIVEAHYQLPFLSWLPKSLAHRYMRLCGRGTTYMENHLSYFELRRLVKGFHLTDYTLKIIRDPARYGAEDMIRPGSVIGKIPGCVLNAIRFLIPTFIFVLEKPHEVKK
jgi:ubiquinone/menaquinone biosynthesis C-methylase UbiE